MRGHGGRPMYPRPSGGTIPWRTTAQKRLGLWKPVESKQGFCGPKPPRSSELETQTKPERPGEGFEPMVERLERGTERSLVWSAVQDTRGNPFQWPFLFCVTCVTHRGQPCSPPPLRASASLQSAQRQPPLFLMMVLLLCVCADGRTYDVAVLRRDASDMCSSLWTT